MSVVKLSTFAVTTKVVTKRIAKRGMRGFVCVAGTMFAVGSLTANATTNTWTKTTGGAQNWEVGGNWSGGSVPSPASGDTVDFSTVNIAANTTLTLQADRTAEIWKFGDTSNGQDWTVNAGNQIILSGTTPTINVVNRTATLNCVLDGSAGLTKQGPGTLTLTGNNSYTGGTTLSAGILSVGSATALGTGTISLNGGTIQSSDATTRTFTDAVTIGGNFTVGGSGNLTFSDTGASALGATRTITVNTGRTATFAQAFSGSGFGITKAGAGTLTLTGANTFNGATSIGAGKIVLSNDGDVTSSTVSVGADNTGLTITGGSGVTSIWNNNGGNFATANSYSNVQVLIDGAGTAGSARLTNVALLKWMVVSSTLSLTNGGQMNVSGEVQIGSAYFLKTGGANMTIGGGTATSTFTGNSGQSFYIGYGDREGSNNNVVNITSGGVLTSVGNMFVGDVNDQQGNDLPSTANKLSVTGTGTASMVSVTVGNARKLGTSVSNLEKANANIVEVTSGGTLTTSGDNYIGRATANYTQANNNTVTVTGTGSRWIAGNKAVYVGYTSVGLTAAESTGNVLTVSTGGVVTNISALIVKAANTLSLGVGGTIYANAVTNAGTLAVALDGSALPTCGCLNVSGNLNLNNATLNVTVGEILSAAPCVIATYGSLTGAFSVTNLPANYKLDTHYNNSNQIALIIPAGSFIELF